MVMLILIFSIVILDCGDMKKTCRSFIYNRANRARASRVTEVSRRGRIHKDKGGPTGAAAERLAGWHGRRLRDL